MKRFILTLSLLVAAGGPAAAAMTQAESAGAQSDSRIMAFLDVANVADIEGGQLAQQKAENPQVREYGQRMVTEHQAMMSDGNRTASQFAIPKLPPTADSDAAAVAQEHVQTMEMLRGQSGSDFDRAYIQHEIETHKDAINKVDESMKLAQHQAVRQLLEQSRPILESHLMQAQSIAKSLQ
jgi:putative membrane protein